MKILHYNIHMWTDADGHPNADRVEALLNEEEPDVVSFVEVDEPWGQPSTLADIARRLGYSWVFVPAFEYRGEGGFGNALLSRTPFSSLQQWQLLPPRLYDGTEPSEPRAIVLASVEVDGTKLIVGSTHLPRYDDSMRSEASSRLLELMDRLPSPWVVCGDFNQPSTRWLADHHALVPSPAMATYPAKEPVEKLDYAVFAGLALRARPLPCLASDHLPIVITSDPA